MKSSNVGLVQAIAAHLSSESSRPEALSVLEGRDLEILRTLCRGSDLRSGVAAEGLAGLLARLSGARQGDGTGAAEKAPGEGPTGQGATGQGATGAAAAEPTGEGEGARRSEGEGERVVSAWREGLAEVGDGVLSVVALEEELAAFAPLLGVGWHRAGTALTTVVCERLGELRQVLARAPELRRVADLLGRQRVGLGRGIGAERGGRVTAVGVKVGGGLEDALASELSLLADPATEDLFLTRLLERRLVSLELTGDEQNEPARPVRRGPAIVLVDTSGSMIGQTSELAKAVALAVVERLCAEHRVVEVALFGGEGAIKTTRFAERKTSPTELFDFLMATFMGGTDFNGPLAWALEHANASGRSGLSHADLLLVTDGRARLNKDIKARIQAARKRGLSLHVAYVDAGLGFDPRGLADHVDGIVTATPAGLTVSRPGRL